MKTYAELLEEKTRIRTSDSNRFTALTMILDGASKAAKMSNQKVGLEDLTNAARSMISSTEKAIELIKTKNGDVSKYEAELALYKDFLGPQLSEEEINTFVTAWVLQLPEDQRTKKNMKEILVNLSAAWKSIDQLHLVDMKLASRLLAKELK